MSMVELHCQNVLRRRNKNPLIGFEKVKESFRFKLVSCCGVLDLIERRSRWTLSLSHCLTHTHWSLFDGCGSEARPFIKSTLQHFHIWWLWVFEDFFDFGKINGCGSTTSVNIKVSFSFQASFKLFSTSTWAIFDYCLRPSSDYTNSKRYETQMMYFEQSDWNGWRKKFIFVLL